MITLRKSGDTFFALPRFALFGGAGGAIIGQKVCPPPGDRDDREGEPPMKSNEKFTQRAENAIENALAEAAALGHSCVGSEHLLLGILAEKDSAAARLLSETDNQIRDVASACGYTDQGYFTKVFTRVAGYSPTAFRRLGGGVLPRRDRGPGGAK